MKKSVLTDLFIYSYEIDKEKSSEKKYKIRIVGLVTDEEVAKIKKNEDLLKNLYTSETVSLMDIAMNSEIEGLRIAGAVHTKDGVQLTSNKSIFISEKIDFVCQVEPTNQQETTSRLMLNTTNGSFMVVEEKIVTGNTAGFLSTTA